jgi:hypothetical protein
VGVSGAWSAQASAIVPSSAGQTLQGVWRQGGKAQRQPGEESRMANFTDLL